MRLSDCPPNSYYEPPTYSVPRCPVCGEETDEYLKDRFGEIVGCRECIIFVSAWEDDGDE